MGPTCSCRTKALLCVCTCPVLPPPITSRPQQTAQHSLPQRVFPRRPCTGSGEDSHPQPQRTHPMGTAFRVDTQTWAATAMEQNSPSTRRGRGAPDPSARSKRRGHTKGGDARPGPTPGRLMVYPVQWWSKRGRGARSCEIYRP